MMSPSILFSIVFGYSLLLLVIGYVTSKKATNATFFLGNKKSPWYVVAYGMIGTSLSGVTFISVPGDVGKTSMSYMMIVFGYFLGYLVIANVLLPLYYRLNLTSIYTYLEQRFGFYSYKTGAFFFMVSRLLGSSFRMFLVVQVLQLFIFDQWGIPFWASVLFVMVLINLYTFKGGIKTIIWTDTLQTTFMIASLLITIMYLKDSMEMSFSSLFYAIKESEHAQIIFSDSWQDKRYFLKYILSGMFITIVMTGLDQDMMQKNLSCKNIKEAKKNMYWLSAMLIPVNFLFLIMGVILYLYAQHMGIALPERTDMLFPTIVFEHLSPFIGVVFIIGLIAAAYSSADGALTALTTSFSIDFLNIEKRHLSEKESKKTRYMVHMGFALLTMLIIVIFKLINKESVISGVLTVAGYTYGPLLGLFAFGLLSKRKVMDKLVPLMAILSPVLSYLLQLSAPYWLNGYSFGFELLLINGLITFLGLYMSSYFTKSSI